MSAMANSALVWNGKRAAATRIVQYSDEARSATAMKTTMAATEERVAMAQPERPKLRSAWVRTPEGLRLRWVAGE